MKFTGATGTIFGIDVYADVTGYQTPTSGGLSAEVEWGDGTSNSYSHISTKPNFAHTYTRLGVHEITLIVSDGQGDAATNSWSLPTYGSDYTPYPPTRILDTRKGLGSTATPVAAQHSIQLKVRGAGEAGNPIPAGATDVVLNVTATEGTANGFLSVYGNEFQDGIAVNRPATSNVSFRAGQDVATLVFASVGADGLVDFYNGATTGTVEVIADVEGYFTATNTNEFFNTAPTRILDTRKGIGTGTVRQVPANGFITLTVSGAGHGTIPESGATAVAVNLTAVDTTSNGFITAYPAGETLPTSSNLNYGSGQTRANAAIVPVGTDGQIVLHNTGTGPVDLIADVSGYFASADTGGGDAYAAVLPPERSVDAGMTSGTPHEVAPAYSAYWQMSMVFNATVAAPSGNGYLTLYPYNSQTTNAAPAASNLNYLAGQTVSNLAIVTIGTSPGVGPNAPSPEIEVYLGGHGTARVILDYFGFFSSR